MLTRQDSSLSSSRRQSATPPPPESHHAKAIGCMPGIFQLFSKYHNFNKRLTFGKKQEKCKQPPPSPREAKTTELSSKDSVSSFKENKTELKLDNKRLSCDMNEPTRSPMIPPEIRRTNPATNSSGNPRTTSSLVARIMGLEHENVKNPVSYQESVAEKRRRLLRALEKCNEDLESLKRIIKSVQSADVRFQPPLLAAKNIVDSWNEKNWTEVGAAAEEELSPVCVLDEFTRSPVNNFTKVQNASGGDHNVAHRKPNYTATKKPGEEDESLILSKHLFFNKSTIISDNNIPSSLIRMRRQATTALSHSKAMVQSVEEVCVDIAWGEKREVGRIGLVLEDHVIGDLIEEVVKEEIINLQCNIDQRRLLQELCRDNPVVLPFEACKRRLRFSS